VQKPEESAIPTACPPHHWLIEGPGVGHQHWTCKRCGATRDHQQDDAEYPPRPWVSTRLKSRPFSE
jgi:transposase-like protein